MPPGQPPVVDLDALDFTRLLADQEQVLAVNPHRHELVLLTGIVAIDAEKHTIVGFKDLGPDEFWVRGHFPKFPVMPGVLMCEAAAQLTSYYMYHQKIVPPDKLVGLGGIESARFRAPVRPGDRLVLVGVGKRTSPKLTRFEVNGYVRRAGTHDLAFEATILGVTLGTLEDLLRA
jgi:3-hydroxyacyl-[acyl-carrier-protein] dehydratase